jgi:hypothetical protein
VALCQTAVDRTGNSDVDDLSSTLSTVPVQWQSERLITSPSVQRDFKMMSTDEVEDNSPISAEVEQSPARLKKIRSTFVPYNISTDNGLSG